MKNKFIVPILSLLVIIIAVSIIFIVRTLTSLEGKTSEAYETAYQTSYSQYQSEGYEVGYEEQFSVGYDSGYELGFEEGNQSGFEKGHSTGETDGYKEGYDSAYSNGREDGRQNGYNDGYSLGIEVGENEGILARVDLHIPTYAEVLAFLRRDKTNLTKYDKTNYNCTDYSAGVINNAESEGIRAAFVRIGHNGPGHTIVAFETTDKGIVYFEPQTDEKVNPVVGKRWYQCVIPISTDYYYEPPNYDDTIINIKLIW